MNKKKIWIPVVAVVLIAACAAGWFLIPRAPTEEVFVYGYDMVGYLNYYQGGTESYGMVTTDRVQSLYLSDTQKVTEILVYQGQEVKKGDVLYRYDTTLSDLELERKELAIEQMELNLDAAEDALAELKKMRPMVIPDEPEEDTDPDKSPKDSNMEGKIYNASTSKGATSKKPYFVWIKSTTQVTEDMILEYMAQTGKREGTVYVLFRVASGTNREFSSEYGVCYTVKYEKVTLSSTTGEQLVGTQNGEPAVTAETDPSEATDPSGSTDSTDPSEATDPSESTDPTDPTDPTETEPPSTDPVLTYEKPVIRMRFFTYSQAADDEIEWNSGYTSSELATMKAEKQAQIDQLKFDIKMGKAELKIMEKEADDGEVKAEFDGVVASVLEPENAVALNAPMIKVTGGGGFYVEGSVSELDLASVQVGQKVTVTSWDTGMTYEGEITEIGDYPAEGENYYSYGMSNLSYYPYKVFIDQSADLQEGYYVSMLYQSEPQQTGTMYLENAFIRKENGESYVYVRGEDGLLEKRVIRTGDSSDGYMTPVLSGLSQTDYIAFPYGKAVVEGAPTVEGTWEDLYGY